VDTGGPYPDPLEDGCITIHDDKREMIVTQVSAYTLQRQSNKDTRRSNKARKSPIHHIEHLNTHEIY